MLQMIVLRKSLALTYARLGICPPTSLLFGARLLSLLQVIVYMKKYVDFFANLCQQDYRFQRYRPSHIAAAAILAARRALCIMWVPGSILARTNACSFSSGDETRISLFLRPCGNPWERGFWCSPPALCSCCVLVRDLSYAGGIAGRFGVTNLQR